MLVDQSSKLGIRKKVTLKTCRDFGGGDGRKTNGDRRFFQGFANGSDPRCAVFAKIRSEVPVRVVNPPARKYPGSAGESHVGRPFHHQQFGSGLATFADEDHSCCGNGLVAHRQAP